MTLLGEALTRASSSLRAANASFAVVGGLAVSVRSEPRFTRDADLAVAVADDAAAESIVFELVRAGYRVIASMEHAATGRLSTVRLSEDGSDRSVVIDLLFASSGIESEVVAHSDVIEVLPRLRLPVATIGDLVALKLLSRDDERRPNDAADLRSLAAVAAEADWDIALASVRLIVERGYGRQRDLEGELVRLRESTR